MKKSELFQNIDTLMTEVLDLKKSWDSKMEKAEEEGAPSDAADDAIHMADHGADEESLAGYAKKLSDEELHELISSLVQEAEGRGGEGEEESEGGEESEESPEMEPEMEKAGEESPEMEPEMESEEASEEPEEEGESDDLGSKVAELSDEEIQTLMSAVQAELAKRGSGTPTEKSDAPKIDWSKVKADPTKPTPQQEREHQNWLQNKKAKEAEEKDESSEKMEKSLKAALKKIDDLTAQVAALKKSNSKKVEHGTAVPAQKYADPKITVLEKSSSDSSKEVMTGATLANWLISEQAAGNKKVNSDLVTKANLSKSVEDASEFYKELERIGIKAPRS